jgi:hypothetical protein
MQDVGVIDARVGTMLRAMHEGQKVERVPTGQELSALLLAASVNQSEITSDAERAWNYGDAEAAEREPHENTGTDDSHRRALPLKVVRRLRLKAEGSDR